MTTSTHERGLQAELDIIEKIRTIPKCRVSHIGTDCVPRGIQSKSISEPDERGVVNMGINRPSGEPYPPETLIVGINRAKNLYLLIFAGSTTVTHIRVNPNGRTKYKENIFRTDEEFITAFSEMARRSVDIRTVDALRSTEFQLEYNMKLALVKAGHNFTTALEGHGEVDGNIDAAPVQLKYTSSAVGC